MTGMLIRSPYEDTKRDTCKKAVLQQRQRSKQYRYKPRDTKDFR